MSDLIRLPFRTALGEPGPDRWTTAFILPVRPDLDLLFGAPGEQSYASGFPARREGDPATVGTGPLAVSASFSFPVPSPSGQFKLEGLTLPKETGIAGNG